jgi:predicted nucleic acid-binding protein
LNFFAKIQLIDEKQKYLYFSSKAFEEFTILPHCQPLEITKNTIHLLLSSHNVEKVIPFYKWNLITTDPEDNKFVDCALNGGADYLVTNDKHFNILKKIDFPRINVVNIDTFKGILKE